MHINDLGVDGRYRDRGMTQQIRDRLRWHSRI